LPIGEDCKEDVECKSELCAGSNLEEKKMGKCSERQGKYEKVQCKDYRECYYYLCEEGYCVNPYDKVEEKYKDKKNEIIIPVASKGMLWGDCQNDNDCNDKETKCSNGKCRINLNSQCYPNN